MRTAESSPRVKARVAGVFYLGTIVTGIVALMLGPGHGAYFYAANFLASAFYIVVTLLFYVLFKPVNRNLSLFAALTSLAGCALGVLGLVHLAPLHINTLVFFGFYCLLIGYLIFRSTFLLRILGPLMAIGGLGYLTFLSPPLAKSLSPYNIVPAVLAEGALTLWLLVMGVNEQRWREQASLIGRQG